MRKKSLIKDIFRDIKGSFGRFISIVAIIALGVAFFSGLKMAPEDMKLTADKYFDDYNFMDLRVVSNLGLTEDDVDAISKLDGIKRAQGSYTMDAIAEDGEKEIALRVHDFKDKDQVNAAKLIEGRFPEKLDECVIEVENQNSLEAKIGSKIKLSSGKKEDLKEDLKNTEFTVVGFIQSPNYLSFEKGNTDIGNGQLRDFIMIPQKNFKIDVFTDILVNIDSVAELNSYKDEYFDRVKPVEDKVKDISKERQEIRYKEIYDEAKEELDEGRKEYEEEKEKAEKELDKALKELEDGRKEIENAEAELRRNENKFYSAIEDGKSQINSAQKKINDGQAEYQKGLKELNKQKEVADKEFKKAEEELDKAEKGISTLESNIKDIELALQNPQLLEEEKLQLEEQEKELKNTLSSSKAEYKAGKEELQKNKEELRIAEQKLAASKAELDRSKNVLEQEKRNLANEEQKGKKELQDARADLNQAKEELEEGEKEYEEEKEKAEKELDEALKEIEKGEEDLKDLEKAEWNILNRKKHFSYVDYGQSADRIDALAKVFPLFFALVAALVSLTTMTRMVDEQRITIGTLKALGYRKKDIASKYIIYAFTATVIGSILGITIGYTLFPIIIFNAYALMYALPPVILNFNFKLASLISIASIALTTITAYLASSNELKENPASLMRPKAPKLGKTILLEKIPVIWNRFNFSYKVTIRNLFRYKRRFFMTVFGIAGCTALIVAGFGIKDSIQTVVDKQYGQIFAYDTEINLDSEGLKSLDKENRIEDYKLVLSEGGKVSFNNEEKDINIIVPRDTEGFNNFIQLQNRQNNKEIKLKNGVVITEGMSRTLDIKKGDTIELINSDDKKKEVKIEGITENYTFNYIYITAENYRKIFNQSLEYNQALGRLDNDFKESEEEIAKTLINNDGINNVSFISTERDNLEDTISSLNYVVLVMIVFAGALAFVVLYNLTNINISERIREIATIKVLGFYNSEVSAYIYRENIILTIIGTITGLIIGIFLHKFIIVTVEMESLMLGLKLHRNSFIYASVLTVVFAVIVNIVMHYKLRAVEMVESLKSVD
ncbi:MAG: FtsX-like permease family protein [Tissierella sp.]|uniref:FtsX-like permease family protein n=1 Tax=Tissierella sp. TaxID=41274 RepID=UPI003F9E6DD2